MYIPMYGSISLPPANLQLKVPPFLKSVMLRTAAGVLLTFGCLTTALSAHAAEPGDVEGLWATGGSLVEVSRNGETLQMIVVALEDQFDANGDPLVDVNNPDEALQTQPILGLDLLADYVYKSKRWQGKIYDPESGNVYSSRMKKKDGLLEMRGYIGTPLLGKTKKFKPISVCREDMLVMLKNSNITGYCGL